MAFLPESAIDGNQRNLEQGNKKAPRAGRANNSRDSTKIRHHTMMFLNLCWLGEPNFEDLPISTNGLWFTRY
jgi:hypothetical protein